jgi:prophage antirepressor-like protein
MSSLSVFEFESNNVRVFGNAENPWFVAVDVCGVLALENISRAMDRLDEDEKRDDLTISDAIGRQQKVWCINESGLFSLILTSRKPQAKLFKKWVTSEVLPSIRKTGKYEPTKPQTMGEIILAQAQMLVDMERRVLTVESEVKQIQERAIAAEKELKSLPPATKQCPKRTARTNINTLIRSFCHANNVEHRKAWGDLYREFRDRHHVDLKIRAANGKCAPLDLAETLDVIEDLYAVAQEIFASKEIVNG